MRMLMQITFPSETFNQIVADGKTDEILGKIMAATRPEAAYFTVINGQRGAVVVVNIEKASEIPAICEPWFLSLDAEIEMTPVMTAEDLAGADLPGLSAAWCRND